MLTGIGLRNFKAFGDEMQETPLSKITLIYGPNSGGKSSIIQALLLLKQSLKSDYYRRSKSDKRELVLNGELVDLSNIQSLLHKHDEKRSLGIGVKFKNLELGDNAEKSVEMTFADDYGNAHMSEVRYEISSCEDEKVLFDAAIDMGRTYITLSDDNGTPVFKMSVTPFRILDVGGRRDSNLALTEFLPSLCFPELEQLREEESQKRSLRPQETGDLLELIEAREGGAALLNALERARRSEVDEKLEVVLGRLELTPDEILAMTPENIPPSYQRHLRSVNYLGPLRSEPQRLYRRSNESDSLAGITGSQGEFSASVLYGGSLVGTTLQWIVKEDVNRWFEQFEIPYQLDVIPFGEASITGEYITIALHDKHTNTQVTLADVGYGINQLLPVIIEGIASQEGSIICVEQPEIHLHPRLQANIADLMIDTINDKRGGNKQWIVETHSELLILRLQRRIREGKIKPEDISVLYVDPNDESTEGSAIKVLRLGEDSYFKDPWPDGFFDDGLKERLPDDNEFESSDDDTNILDKLFSE